MAKDDMIELEGIVTESLPNTTFHVDIGNGVKPMCEKCKVIKRKGKVMVICENPKHKQRQG